MTHLAIALTDLCYAIVAIVTAPVWLVRMIWTGKIRTDWPARLGRGEALPARGTRPRILIHAVSVGEVNAIRGLVERLANDRMQPEVVVSVTTDTGIDRARKLFGEKHSVVRTPFDFSFAVGRWSAASFAACSRAQSWCWRRIQRTRSVSRSSARARCWFRET
jgi:3-deoxy-D-manno-octulosonic-acid transferase